ncbi:PAS domain-containing sensor histidine kinase [Castellaniella sp.]|uniref:PAS domain-containing sensor histidine kinase n=1 Tax=Castellaniella sp. TaxID=1955812 RepID=UPI003A946FF7
MKPSLDLPPLLDIIRSTAEPIITINATHRIVMFNPAAEQLFQCDAARMIGETMDLLIPARFRKVHAEYVTRFQATGVTERSMGAGMPLWGLKANGEEFPMEALISRIETSSGICYLSVFLRDITQRQQVEQALLSSRDELTRLSNALLRERELEKRHVARELHDDIGQSLTALTMELSQLEAALPSRRADVIEHIDAMRNLIKTAFVSLRRIASDLRPVMLDDLGLVAAVEWLTSDFRSRYGIAVETRVDTGQQEFPTVMATVLFRVAQEALTNVAKHAHATSVLLELLCTQTQCTLIVQDNGVGTTPEHLAKVLPKRLGLLGMRERVRLLGGSVSVHTRPGEGLRLEVLVPMKSPAPE